MPGSPVGAHQVDREADQRLDPGGEDLARPRRCSGRATRSRRWSCGHPRSSSSTLSSDGRCSPCAARFNASCSIGALAVSRRCALCTTWPNVAPCRSRDVPDGAIVPGLVSGNTVSRERAARQFDTSTSIPGGVRHETSPVDGRRRTRGDAAMIPVAGADAESATPPRHPNRRTTPAASTSSPSTRRTQAQALQAIADAGGVVIDVHEPVGLALVSADAGFATAVETDASVTGASPGRVDRRHP